MNIRDLSRGLAAVAALALVTAGAPASSVREAAAREAATPNVRAQQVPSKMALGARQNGVPDGAVFNYPDGDAEDRNKIVDHLVWLIDGVEAGEEIYIASYRFDELKVAEALIQAAGNGVAVKVLLDQAASGTQSWSALRREIGADAEQESWVRLCDNGASTGDRASTACIGKWKMHNKIYMFSRTHGTPNVVVQSTANLENEYSDEDPEDNSGTHMWNSAYTEADNKWLYDEYIEHFNDMSKMVANGDYYLTETGRPETWGHLKVFHSPRSSGNTIREILSRVKCDGNSSGGTSDGEHRTIVRVAVWSIAGANGTALAQDLWELDNRGCYVDIVVDETRYGAGEALRTLLKKPTGKYHGPEVREFTASERGLHEKNLMIDGNFAGNPNQNIVFTGSMNFNNKSMDSNDETWLRINSPAIHDQFVQNFKDIRCAAFITWQASKEPLWWDKGKPSSNCAHPS